VDILEVIKGEHRQVATMLDQVDALEPGDEKVVELARNIEQALSAHLAVEERVFYSRLRQRAEDEEELVDVYEGYTEHDVANHLIELLKSGRKPDEKFKAELQVLGESVKHHVKEEESKIFAIARQVIDSEEREELGETWAKAKQRFLAGPAKKKTAKKTAARSSAARSSTKKKKKSR